MNLTTKTITLHGGREIYVLTPQMMNCNITAGHDKNDFVMILANGSGYQFLAECFSIAAELQQNELLYLPVQFKGNDEFTETFSYFDYNLDIICTNYCETQISPKEIENVLQKKVYAQQSITRSANINKSFIDSWKTDRRLTVKIHKKNLFITTNRDGFSALAYGADHLAAYGDDVKYNTYPPHDHFDWDENTSVSTGVTLYYWHNE